MDTTTDRPIAVPATPETMPRQRRSRLAMVVAIAATAALALAACEPAPGPTIRHQAGPNWVWFGPSNWISSHSTNTLVVTSPTGENEVVSGFSPSPVPCPASTSLAALNTHFDARRVNLRDLSGLTNWRTESRTRPFQMPPAYGPSYFRQNVNFTGTDSLGRRVQGEASMDVFPSSPSCGTRLISRVGVQATFPTNVKVMRNISNATYYFGSGV